VIPWVSIGAGFPTIPLALSHMCTDFDFYLNGTLSVAQDHDLCNCFPFTGSRRYPEPGMRFLASRDFPVTCRGFDATAITSAADSASRTSWLQELMQFLAHNSPLHLICRCIIVSMPAADLNDSPLASIVKSQFDEQSIWRYRCDTMATSWCGDMVAAARWIYMFNRVLSFQPFTRLGLVTSHAMVIPCLPYIDASLNTLDHLICTITEDDADTIYAMTLTHVFMPVVTAQFTTPESASQEREQHIVHQDYPCPEVTHFGSPRK
jgi:hypothetical protein